MNERVRRPRSGGRQVRRIRRAPDLVVTRGRDRQPLPEPVIGVVALDVVCVHFRSVLITRFQDKKVIFGARAFEPSLDIGHCPCWIG